MTGAQAMPGGAAMGGLADFSFRLSRLCMLVLIVIMPMAAITAAREVAMVGFSVFLVLHFAARRSFVFRPTPLLIPLLLYLVTVVISMFSAVDLDYSLHELRSETVKGLVIFYSAVHLVQDREHVTQAYGTLMGGLAIMAMGGLVLFFADGGSLLGHGVRAGSLQNGYGGLSTYLVTVWPFLLLSFLVFTKPYMRALLAALVVLTLGAAYLTYSRAGWLGITVETGLCLILLSRRRLVAALACLLVLVLAVGMLMHLPGSSHGEKWEHLWSQPEDVGGTAGDLISVWQHSLREISDHPFRGIGLGRHSFSKAYPEFRKSHQFLLWHAHNMFVDVTLQLGVQGLLAVLIMLGVIVWSLWPNSPPAAGDGPGAFMAATVVMTLGFCVRNLTDDFFADDSALLLWLLLGLAMGVKALAKPSAMH